MFGEPLRILNAEFRNITYRVFLTSPPQKIAMRTAGRTEIKVPARRGIRGAAVFSLEFAIIAAGYLGLAQAWLLVPSINPSATPLWPPTGLALALMLVRGYRIWPAILVGAFSFQFLVGRAIPESASIATGTMLAALAGSWVTS